MQQDAKLLIEKIGIFSEKAGFPPAAARIFAYLMLVDPPQQSFEDLQTALQISKSAVSNALTILQMKNLVEYITLPGQRKRYFRLNKEGFYVFFKKRITARPFVEELLNAAISMRSDQYPEMNEMFEKVKSFYAFMVSEMQISLDKWNTLHGEK